MIARACVLCIGGFASVGVCQLTTPGPIDRAVKLPLPSPEIRVLSDDRVATVEMDYEAGNPATHFELGEDRLGPVGYRVLWFEVPEALRGIDASVWTQLTGSFGGQGVPSSRSLLGSIDVSTKVTALRRTQIQPLTNDTPWYVRVDYVNREGRLVGTPTGLVFDGGSGERVDRLRAEMTGFFDDFNRPEGLPDELNWNTTFSQTNDPAMQAFFINPQFHTHTLVGTPRHQLFGDRGQTTHRARNRLFIEDGQTRRIVFDIDGVQFASRAIWYLDLVQREIEMTSHVDVDGGQGLSGYPSPGIRFSLNGQEVAVYRFDEAGRQVLIAKNRRIDLDGVQALPNVRRAVEIRLDHNQVAMTMDGVTILDTPLGDGTLETGDYTVLWSAFGYNTMKVGMPYFLIHWDNFGFDGPPPASTVLNYRAQIQGTDLVRSNNHAPVSVTIPIPDDLVAGNAAPGRARLVFVRQMDNWDYAQWSPEDTVNVNGVEFPVPEPVSDATPPLGLTDLINSNAAYSTFIDLGTVSSAGTSPVATGDNTVTFSAARCAFHNVHIEIEYPTGTAPAYTPPEAVHYAPVHRDFMKVGMPARISRIAGEAVDNNPWYSNFLENFNRTISGVVDIDILVNADDVSDNPARIASNYVSATLASAGENPGLRNVRVWIRPDGTDASAGTLLGFFDTTGAVAAPQFSGTVTLDTTAFPDGVYELSVIAEDSRGILSQPDFGGVGEQVDDASELSGFYYPLHVTIQN